MIFYVPLCLFLLGLIAGCVVPYKLPCEFDVHVKIDKHQAVNEACHDGVEYSDTGRKIKPWDRINGCTPKGQDSILAANNDAVIGHEIRHKMDEHCK